MIVDLAPPLHQPLQQAKHHQMQDLPRLWERTYSLGAACRLAGAEPRRVTVWYQRGHVTLGEMRGEKRRALSLFEVLQLALLTRLAAFSTVENAASWSREAMRHVGESLRAKRLDDPVEAAAWMAPLGVFVFAPDYTSDRRTVRLQHIEWTLEGANKALREGITPAPFLFLPLGSLFGTILDRLKQDVAT